MKDEKIQQVREDILKPNGDINPKSTFILAVDPSRTGKDQTGIVILEQLPFSTNIFVSIFKH